MKAALAVSKDLAIGKQGKLPWHLVEDFKNFKKLTLNNRVIMGRKTAESFREYFGWSGLPKRENYVLTANEIQLREKDSCKIVANSEDLIEYLDTLDTNKTNWLIGGATLYDSMYKALDEIHITLVDADYSDADTRLQAGIWKNMIAKLVDWIKIPSSPIPASWQFSFEECEYDVQLKEKWTETLENSSELDSYYFVLTRTT